MSQCSGFTDELDSVLDRDSVSDHGADCAGTVQETAILPAADSSPQQTEDECTHPVIFNSICATCFKIVEEQPGDATLTGGAGDAKVDLRYLGLQVSQNHLKEQSEQQMRHLLSQKKLVIVFDLDHTLLHTELKSRLYPEAIEQLQRIRQSQQGSKAPDQPATVHTTAATDTSQQPSAEDAHPSRKRARDASTPAPASDTNADTAGDKNPYATVYDNGDSYTKLRPGAFEMLEALRNCCELRIFTMGNPQYACAMASLLDKSGALFRNRIVARDDADPAWRFKGLQKVGAMPTLTAIIDDTVDVWRPELANLIRIPRYHFFLPGGRAVADLASDEDARRGPLATITRLLLDVHSRFFNAAPPGAVPAARPCSSGKSATGDAAPGADSAAEGADGAAVQAGTPGKAGVDAEVGDRGGAGPAGATPEQEGAALSVCSGEDDPGKLCDGRSNHGRPRGEDAAAGEARPLQSHAAVGACDQQGLVRSPPEASDVRRILDDIRRSILRGCVIVFSRVFDNSMRAAPEQHSLWQLALALGAQCRTDVAEGTTHLVTLSCATDKARNALRQNTKLVSPDWLIACECGWARLLEEDYPAPAPEIPYTLWRQNIGAEHAQALKLRGAV